MKEIELIQKRKAREKHFLQPDGTIVARLYDNDVHFLKNGKYEEIDNTLIKEQENYTNKSNDYKVFFHEQSKNYLVKLEKDNYYFTMKIGNSHVVKAEKMKKITSLISGISFKNILDDIDVEYENLPNKVKETIILRRRGIHKISFDIDTNLNLKIENNSIIASDNHQIIFIVEKPYMKDSNEIVNYNVSYELKQLDSKYTIDLKLDEEWLNSEEVKYPIYIDPTVLNYQQTNSVYDTFIYPGDTGIDKNSLSYLKIGVEKVNNTYITNRALLKFELPEIGTGSEIISANLILQTCYAAQGNNAERTLEIHKITPGVNWTEENATWEQMHDKFDSKVETLQFLQRRVRVPYYELDENNRPVDMSYDINTYSEVYNDITNLVKHWYKDTPNNGIMIKANPEIYIDDNYSLVYSKNNTISDGLKPLLEIVYRNQNGLESYLNYKSQVFVDGSTYVNTYNGNLVGVFNLGNTISNKLPVSLNLIYNTNDVLIKNNGFKFNLNQTIHNLTLDNNEYLEYEDEDGTIHYFYKEMDSSTIYYDEDGLNLTIEKDDTCCYMSDKYNNKKIFQKSANGVYYLTKIEDVSLNAINIILDSNNRITKIQDGNNLEILIQYENNKTIVTSPDRITTLNYSSNSVTSIITMNGTTSFAYNENNLISDIIDVSGLRVKYEYYEQRPYRIKKVTQYGLNNTLGNYFLVEYGFDSTNITDHKGKTYTLIFNSYGNLLSTNIMPSGEDISNAYSISGEYGNNFKDKNKLLTSTIPVQYVKNYLYNTSFEVDNGYFCPYSGSGLEVSFSTDYAHSGYRSLKAVITEHCGCLTLIQRLPLESKKYYTFSGYFKSEQKGKIIISYNDWLDQTGYEITQDFESSEDFERHDITLYLDADTLEGVHIFVKLLGPGTCYIDDIQLEEGQVANNYNILENSDFSNGLSDWVFTATKENYNCLDEYGLPQTIDVNPSEVFQVVSFNEGKNKALQVNMDPVGRSHFEKEFLIKGKKGDIYDLSFWIKNEGLLGDEIYVGSTVMVYFKPIGKDAEYCIMTNRNFVPNEKWQFISHKCYAEEDYESIKIIFYQGRQANKMWITNLTFYKDLNTEYYSYDSSGNLITATDSKSRINEFKYNQDNQLVSSTTPRGKHFKYEYDNVKTDLLLNAVSSMGISNRIKYDTNHNPISTIISKKESEELIAGEYKIRSKGTEKYIKAEYNNVLMETDSCSNTIWKLEKVEEEEIEIDQETGEEYSNIHTYFKMIYSMIPDYFIQYLDNMLILNTSDVDNLFILESNDNGSYYMRLKEEDKYVKVKDSTLELSSLIHNDPSFEFYFEVMGKEFIENNATYTEDGRFVESVTDSLFNETTFVTDSTTGLVTSMTNANNQTTNYTYNNKKQITSISQGDKKITYSYNEQNLLSEINQENKRYQFLYDEFLNPKKVMIGDTITLITNEYGENNGNLLKTTYGNNQEISFEYDEFDRIKMAHKMDKDYYYLYDSNGNLAKILTNNLISTYDVRPIELEKWYDSITKYTYDDAKRIQEYIDDDFVIDYTYDVNDNVINKKYKLDTITHFISNAFDKDDMLTKSVIDSNAFNYQYDELGRLVNKNINNSYHTFYDYVSIGKRTSTLINSITNGNDKYSYKYDKLGNITHIYCNEELVNKYYYDEYNELIKEEDYQNNVNIKYNYDKFGNLLTKSKTNLETNAIISLDTYQYSNSNWEDQLTNFNGSSITYDEIGNPLTIGNSITMEWINGRSLYNYSDSSNDLDIIYDYDVNGIRTSKIVNGNQTKYYLENSNIIYEKRGTDTLYYLYDLTGLIGLKYNDDVYYYVKNLQEDIIGILDSNYNKIVSYKYDSWGKVLSVKDQEGNEITNPNHIGIMNPFRYRSYYYDEETKLYYLNSRYYNPEWGRFLNADGIIGANMDIFGCNLYSYVSNNPIMLCDIGGKLAVSAGLTIIGAVATIMIMAVAIAAPSVALAVVQATNDAILKVQTHNAEKSKSNPKKEEANNHNVYVLKNRNTRVIEYVGRTQSIEQTEIRHNNNPYRADLWLDRIAENVSKETARGLEQMLIIECRTLNRNKEFPMNNQINGVAFKNHNYSIYWDAALTWASENELPCK